MIDDRTGAIIKSYLDSSERDIEIAIGRIYNSKEELNSAEFLEEEKALLKFKEYYEEKLNIFKHIICVEWEFNKKAKSEEFQSNIELVATIGSLLSNETRPIASLMVATLLVKKGLHLLCKN